METPHEHLARYIGFAQDLEHEVYGSSPQFSLLRSGTGDAPPQSASIASLIDAPRSYILDTGAARHLTCRKNLTHSARSRIYEASTPINLATANGTLHANQMADYFVPSLGQTLSTYCLQNTPDVFAAGLLCEEGDFASTGLTGASALLLT